MSDTVFTACTENSPLPRDTHMKMRVYHPDAKVFLTSDCGRYEQFKCPHCARTWWVTKEDG